MEFVDDLTRACTKCGDAKPLAEFSAAPRGKYGRKASCKACDAARHAALHPPGPRKPLPKRREAFTGAEEKACSVCGVVKPLATGFSLSRRASDTRNAVYRGECKPCASAVVRKWQLDNPEKYRAACERRALAKYGLTVDDYWALHDAQDGLCAICERPEVSIDTRTGEVFRLSVDHCHESGKVRGLLCHRCNRAIGLLDDDPDVLRKAIGYLLPHKEGAAS